MSVSLHSLRFPNPSAPALVILHGLLGSSRNWLTIGRALQSRLDVHILDLRNHGQSPHAARMRWSDLCADLEDYLNLNGLSEITLMGHSLGGKIAMRFACQQPSIVKQLIIVDIAAKPYPPYHDNEFRAMKRLPVAELVNRKEAEELLSPSVPDWAMRQFLLTNLVRDESKGSFTWQINLEVLHDSLPHIRQNSLLATDRFNGSVLLIRGGRSKFVEAGDIEEMRHWFPHLKAVTLPNAGHNLHVEDRKGFLNALEALEF